MYLPAYFRVGRRVAENLEGREMTLLDLGYLVSGGGVDRLIRVVMDSI